MSAAMKLPHGSFLLVLLCGFGCGESPFNTGTQLLGGAAVIRVEPVAFLGAVPCEPGVDGALESYEVDLYDVTAVDDAGEPLEAIQSPRIPCARSANISVTAERLYAAEIRGYETGRAAVGDAGSDLPTWTARCGQGSWSSSKDS